MLKFDLDLPSASEDDTVLDDGMRLPEWDWKKQQLLTDHCRVVLMRADEAEPCALPPHLSRTAKKLRNQFQALAPARVWHRAQAEGDETRCRIRNQLGIGHAPLDIQPQCGNRREDQHEQMVEEMTQVQENKIDLPALQQIRFPI